jgi:hypothetical protein
LRCYRLAANRATASSRRRFLKDDFKKELLQRDPDYIRSLPGHSENRPGDWLRLINYNDLLENLLRRDVLGRFAFFSLPGT